MQIQKRENTITEKQYRNDMKRVINASAVKLFINDKERFVKEIVEGEPRESKQTASTLMGHLVHTLILESREVFDEKYTITQMIPPSGQMLELINEMYSRDRRTRTEDGSQTIQFESIFMESVQEVRFRGGIEEVAFKKKTPEWILAKFTEPDKETGIAPEQYYKELLQNHGKQVVTMYQIEKAEKIAAEMRANEWINKWVNAVDSDHQHVYSECVVQFKYKELEMKALIDRFIVNSITKTVEPCDIKSTWDGDGVSYTYMTKLWYVQAAVYDMALKQFIIDQGLEGYTLLPIRWLICDTTSFQRSHSYLTSEKDLEMAYKGFKTKTGRYWPGVLEILDEIIYEWSNLSFNTTKAMIENNGVCSLDINYYE